MLAQRFQNGDIFFGSSPGTEMVLPNGPGQYRWADGSVYDGEWADGLRHGQGTYTWPSGAAYEGEWRDGHMHGQGTYTSRDGGSYKGGWMNDLKHGLGTKHFPNGDVYTGLWKAGQASGPGQYKWASGNEYNGEWAAGRMTGRGTFVWSTGERYDGDWKDGKEHGRGTFTWQDGSYFDGNWREGEKHGVGVWCPAAPTDRKGSRAETFASPVRGRESSVGDAAAGGASAERDAPSDVMLRTYDNGHLVKEELVPDKDRPRMDPVAGLAAKKTRRKREVVMGETIYKGAPSYDLMLQLQLGIRWSVGRVTPESARNLSERDFQDGTPESSVSIRFPRGGSSTTPPHAAHDFKWKDYCPMVFRKLRERFGIDAGEYMLSLCGDQALRELSSPGKSGSVFFLSQNGAFIVKTMRKAEMVIMRQQLLSKYLHHVMFYPETMLTKFFGLHRVKPHGGQNVRFVVMGNLFCTELRIHRRFDLKGSTHGRLTPQPYNPESKILKDLDLDYRFQLPEGCYPRLMKQIAADCNLLEELNIMDYSMLLGVHYKSAGATRGASALPPGTAAKRTQSADGATADGEQPAQQQLRSPQPRLKHTLTLVVGAGGSPRAAGGAGGAAEEEGGGAGAGAEAPGQSPDELEAAYYEELGAAEPVLGENMVGMAIPGRVLAAPKGVQQGPLPTEAAAVVLNFGIIDILQEYNVSKKVEHAWKAVLQGQHNISAVNPSEYSKRFQDFMRDVFC